MHKKTCIPNRLPFRNIRGSIIIEATILLPICFMIMLALVMLSMYLPQRAFLQRATQVAATALAIDHADTSLSFDDSRFVYAKSTRNVYLAMFEGVNHAKAERIVRHEMYNVIIQLNNAQLSVNAEMINFLIYREIRVTAQQSITVPIDFSFISFPQTIDIVVSSNAVVPDGDEFLRNVDMAIDLVRWMSERFGIEGNALQRIPEYIDRFLGFE